MNTKARNTIIDFEEILNGLLDHHQETTGEIVPVEIKSLMLNYGQRTALMMLSRFMGFLATNENIKNGQFAPIFNDFLKEIAAPFKEGLKLQNDQISVSEEDFEPHRYGPI
jgi:hypothetical protein